MKRKISLILAVIVVISAVCVFTSCAPSPFVDNGITTVVALSPSDSTLTDTFVVSDMSEKQDFHTQLQQQYLADDYNNIAKYAKGTSELSQPEAITLDWFFKPTTEPETDFVNYQVLLSEDNHVANYTRYETHESKLQLYNLKIATCYYYKVTAVYRHNSYTSKICSFETTEQGPRNLYIDGISNCRDLGGHVTTDGGIVKQGLIFRTARLNTSNTDTVTEEISGQGKLVMTEQLGVKTEIDLRGETDDECGGLGENADSLLEGVTYCYCPMRWNNIANLLMGNNEITRKVFAILADESNYPLFYHCSIGTDRTGFLTILINGLLGVSEEDLYRDYLFSNFGNIGGSRSLGDSTSVNSVIGYMNFIKSYHGDTLAEQIYHFLVSIGVPHEQLDSVIDILKEGGGNEPMTDSVFITAQDFTASNNFVLTQSSNVDTPECYYNLRNNVGNELYVNLTSNGVEQVDVYVYVHSTSTTVYLDSTVRLAVNNIDVAVPHVTYDKAGCRTSMKTWVPVHLATVDILQGENTFTVTVIKDSNTEVYAMAFVAKTDGVFAPETMKYK